jgi:hypothetical protein
VFFSVLTPSKSPEKQTGRGLERKEGKRAESEAAQGFKSETPIVENFLGCKGQEAVLTAI